MEMGPETLRPSPSNNRQHPRQGIGINARINRQPDTRRKLNPYLAYRFSHNVQLFGLANLDSRKAWQRPWVTEAEAQARKIRSVPPTSLACATYKAGHSILHAVPSPCAHRHQNQTHRATSTASDQPSKADALSHRPPKVNPRNHRHATTHMTGRMTSRIFIKLIRHPPLHQKAATFAGEETYNKAVARHRSDVRFQPLSRAPSSAEERGAKYGRVQVEAGPEGRR
jgi:hypothetical protein